MGARLPVWSVLPFAGILLSIAFLPLLAPRFWRRHYATVSIAWAAAFVVPIALAFPGDGLRELFRTCIAQYIPFLVLLYGLYAATAGIVIRGAPKGRPGVNTALLLAATAAASLIGTTGASLLFVGPLLRANAERTRRTHTFVF